jgi:hypothetical protein
VALTCLGAPPLAQLKPISEFDGVSTCERIDSAGSQPLITAIRSLNAARDEFNAFLPEHRRAQFAFARTVAAESEQISVPEGHDLALASVVTMATSLVRGAREAATGRSEP